MYNLKPPSATGAALSSSPCLFFHITSSIPLVHINIPHIGLLYQCIIAHTSIALLFTLTMPLQFCCASRPHSCCVLVDALWFLFVKSDSNKNRNQFLSKPPDLFFMHRRPRKQPLHFLPSAFFAFTRSLSHFVYRCRFYSLSLSLTHIHVLRSVQTHLYTLKTGLLTTQGEARTNRNPICHGTLRTKHMLSCRNSPYCPLPPVSYIWRDER